MVHHDTQPFFSLFPYSLFGSLSKLLILVKEEPTLVFGCLKTATSTGKSANEVPMEDRREAASLTQVGPWTKKTTQ